MSGTILIPELDLEQMGTGFMWVTKQDEKGPQRGLMPVSEVCDTMRELLNWEAAGRHVKLVSRFVESDLLAFGQNGGRWLAVKEISPSTYYLVTRAPEPYQVHLPRLLVVVSNHGAPRIFWTPEERIEVNTKLYPLMIGNTYATGAVCLGNTGLKCSAPDEIDKYIRQVIEAPAPYLVDHAAGKDIDKLYRALAKRWAPGLGKKHGITVNKLFAELR